MELLPKLVCWIFYENIEKQIMMIDMFIIIINEFMIVHEVSLEMGH